jgi:hypothetical protein
VTNQVYIYILFCSLLLRSLCFIATKHFKFFSTSSQTILSVPDERYSSNVSCTLNWISTFIIVLLGGGGQISSNTFYVDISILALHLIFTLLLGFLSGEGVHFSSNKVKIDVSILAYIYILSWKSITFRIL